MAEGEYAHRVSAAALARRGLVKTVGRGPNWSASTTEAGRSYLEQANGPDAPQPRQANASVTQQLVDYIVAAGGFLRLPQKGYMEREGVDYQLRAQLAERYGRVPIGKRLITEMISGNEIELRLVDAPKGTSIETDAVPVPAKVARYHPVVRRFRDGSDRHEISRATMGRALRILQGLVTEAERRGHRVEPVPPSKRTRYGNAEWTGPRNGHIVITADDHPSALRFSEEGLPSRVHWEKQNQTYDTWGHLGGKWKLPPLTEYEAGATGRLQLDIPGYGGGGRPSKWADRKSWSLEEKLPEVLREIEVRAAEAKAREKEAEQREIERARKWETAKALAVERWAENRRGEVLRADVARWREAKTIRDYCDAASATYRGDSATEWIDWARGYADNLDPLSSPPQMPEMPETVSLEDLRPYLDGWDPYTQALRRW